MTSDVKNNEVLIRRARPEDYEDIMEIGDVYNGTDYLLAEYSNFLREPDIKYPLVAEVDGQVVGFYCNYLIDGVKTVIKRAGRVHKSYRGRGIYHMLGEALDKQRKREWPDVQYEVIGVTGFAEDRADQEFRESGFVQLLKKRILQMVFRQSDFMGKAQLTDFDYIKRLTYDDLKLLLCNETMVDKLFPKGIIFNNYKGYRPMEANILYLDNKNAEVYATTFNSSPAITPLASESSWTTENGQNSTPDMIRDIDFISFALKYKAQIGLVYALDLYAVDGYSESALTDHIRKHIYKFRESTKTDGVLVLTFDMNIDGNKVIACLKKHGIVDSLPGSETHSLFYVKRLHNSS